MSSMRSYNEYCAVAKSLDVVGDRWTLLIVRELLLRGCCRYTDLRNGLPGIATNLLAQRLRELEAAELITRATAPPPIATTVFDLTARGRELGPVIRELGRFGASYMVPGPAAQDEFRAHWLAFPAREFLTDSRPDDPPVQMALRVDDEEIVVRAAAGEVTVSHEAAADPDVTLEGSPHAILGVLTGRVSRSEARALGLRVDGDWGAVKRLVAG